MKAIISPKLINFIRATILNFTTWDLLVFFYTENEKIFSINDISDLIGRPDSEISKSIEILIKQNIIEKKIEGENIKYSYSNNNDYEDEIKEFILKLSEREARLLILGIVLDNSLK